jgi:hypothetical protein
MPRTADDVETFLYRLNRNFDHNGEGMFIIASRNDGPPIVVYVDDPIIIVRVDIGQAPDDENRQLRLYKQMLQYNATELVHASYALEGKEMVLSAGIPLENVDMNEIAAVLEDMEIAIARHVGKLRELAVE